MKKENVLEIEFKEVWDNKWAWKIIKNEIDFKNTGVEIVLHHIKINCANKEKLYLFDNWLAEWELIDSYTLIDLDLKIDIQDFVNYINKKYGIPKRWRAEKYKEYFYIGETGLVRVDKDIFSYGDDMLYNLGNYFKTKEEAEKVIDSKEWQDFWAKVRAGEIGDD
ncbi:hypothetical protein [Fusobacterium animalis]|uniref:hypothetical protein n=1 Tax=Fusobacterium animalis TaxID=76859 RepID=UPI0030D581EC